MNKPKVYKAKIQMPFIDPSFYGKYNRSKQTLSPQCRTIGGYGVHIEDDPEVEMLLVFGLWEVHAYVKSEYDRYEAHIKEKKAKEAVRTNKKKKGIERMLWPSMSH